jgi:hypothetical protein
VLRPIYLSLTLQMTTVVLCLAFSGRHLWLRTYTLAFLCAALVCIAISAALPAAGAWPHYGLTASDSGILPTCPRSGRFRGDHHLPEPACRAGRSRYCRALAGEIPALGGSHPQYSDAHRYTHRRLALFQRRPRRSGFGRFIPPHRSDRRSAGARTSSTARGELAPSACCVFAFSSRRSARACAFRTI